MYYHIDIWGPDGALMMRSPNLKRETVQNRVLPAYRHGNPLTLDGRTVSTYSIDRIRILETDHEVNPMASYHDESLREMGYTYSTEERDITNQWITGPPGQESPYRSESDMTISQEPDIHPATDARDVFVVHGRNNSARNAMFEFLRALGLHPLEWQELVATTEQGSPYIGEILDVAFSRAHAVVVLMTPDDEARLREQFRNENEPAEFKLKGQARPNVLFEAGRAFGRHAQRTILVEIGELRPFSDVVGRHAVRFDGSAERRHELAQRLKSAGCPVNTDGSDWLTAGDFAVAIALATAVDPGEGVEIREWQDATTADGRLQISSDAAELLAEAAENGDGRIIKVADMGGTFILSGPREFTTMGDRRSEARWVSALDELVYHDLAQFHGGEVYDVTHQGFVVADSFKANQQTS